MTTNQSNKNYSLVSVYSLISVISVIRALLLLTLSFSAVVSCGADDATPTSLAEKPGAPTSVTDAVIDNVDGSISLSWSAPTNLGKNSAGKTASITGYKVEYSNAVAKGWVELTTNRTGVRLSASIISNSTSARIIGLTPGTIYYFRVLAVNEAGVGLASAVKVVGFNPTPKNVTSTTVNPQTVNLALSDMATLTLSYLPANATNANVTWSSGETRVATVTGNNSSATVTAVGAGVATITVNAGTVNAGVISKSVTVKVMPASPANFQQTAADATTADLEWNPSSGIGINYKIYQVRDGTPVLLSTITGNTYKATGLTAITSYQYQLKACADNTDTACSGPVPLTVVSSSSSGKDLAAIIAARKIPADLNTYDESSQDVFGGYAANTVVARYVLPGGAGNQSGDSWANAAANPKTVLDGIGDSSFTKVYAVLLGPGVYKAGVPMAMKNYVTMVGGVTTRNIIPVNAVAGSTVLSGNNSYQVFSNANLTTYGDVVRLSLMTIADGNSSTHGGGMFNNAGTMTLTKVVFSNNTASYGGGGMYNLTTFPILNKVVFSGNTADYGAGMANSAGGVVLTKVIFSGNTARYNGGGIHSVNATEMYLNGVVFSGNTATQAGGAVNINNNGRTFYYIVNSIFWGNRVGGKVENITFFNDNSGGQETLSLYKSIVEGGMPAGYASGTTVTDFNGGGFTSSGGTGNIVVNFSSIISIDPGLGPLTDNGGGINTMKIQTGSSAVNQGLYVKSISTSHYYSSDGSKWYLNPALTGGMVTPPADAVNVTATDMTGYPVSGKPDIGVYEAR